MKKCHNLPAGKHQEIRNSTKRVNTNCHRKRNAQPNATKYFIKIFYIMNIQLEGNTGNKSLTITSFSLAIWSSGAKKSAYRKFTKSNNLKELTQFT